MSTKINVRSPFYLSYSEPTEPSVELTCALINLNNFSVDQFGELTLPNTTYGTILSTLLRMEILVMVDFQQYLLQQVEQLLLLFLFRLTLVTHQMIL